MTISPFSLLSLAAIGVGLVLAWTRRFPAIWVLAITNVVVFVATLASPVLVRRADGSAWYTVQEELSLHSDALQAAEPMAFVQLFASAFVHADFFHLFGNMLIFLILGNPFEDRIGGRAVTGLYLATAAAGAITELGMNWGEPIVLLGASGAVFGILGAFAGAYPNAVTGVPIPLPIIMPIVRMRVWIGAVMLGAAQFLFLFAFVGLSRTAYMAHVGGLLAGIVLGILVVRRKAPARQPQPIDLRLLTPFATEPASADALHHMQSNHDEPAVFQAWLDRFFRTARCPECQHRVVPHHKGEVVCTQGHRFDVRAK